MNIQTVDFPSTLKEILNSPPEAQLELSFMFGDWAAAQGGYEALGIPKLAGYTVGYRLARAFLSRTGMSVTEATYLPRQEIVEASGYFAKGVKT